MPDDEETELPTTRRDVFAAVVLHAMMSGTDVDVRDLDYDNIDTMARDAYVIADALEEARGKRRRRRG